MTEQPDIELDTASPEAVFEAVAEMADGAFAALMDGPHRGRVIDALVAHMVGLFRSDRADEVEAVIHVKLWDRPGGGYDHYELVIRDGACRATAPPEHEPQLTLKVRPSDLRALVTGRTGPRRLALRGRLRVIGDLGLGTKLPSLFSFPSD